MAWTDDVATYLLDTATCPRCHTRAWNGAPAIQAGVCVRCGADLRGDAGAALWAASHAVVDASRRRDAIVAALPSVRPTAAPAASAPSPASAAAVPVGAGPAPGAPARERSTISLQSVLAVVGAGLLAVAAIVFTFLNPDLTDFATRTTIIGVVTVLFLGGAWLLNSRRLRFSAEAVGALGMVFLALDVWAFSRAAPDGVSAWFFGALGAFIAGAALVTVGSVLRLRTWIWTGFVALAIWPALVGYGIEHGAAYPLRGWPSAWGHVAVLFAAWALLELSRRVARRLESRLLADRVTLTVVQLLAALAAVTSFWLGGVGDHSSVSRILGVAAVLGALALGAFLTSRVFIPVFWSVVGGALGASAVVTAVLAIPDVPSPWATATLPALAAAVVLLVVAVLRRTGSVRRGALVASTTVVAALTGLTGFSQVLSTALGIPARAWGSGSAAVIDVPAATDAAASVLGLGALALGQWALARGSAQPRVRSGFAVSASWTAAAAVLGAPYAFPGGASLAIAYALGLGVASALLLLAVPGVRSARPALRAPLITLAHALPVVAVMLSWPEASIAAVTGAAAVAVLALAARTVPQRARPVHAAAGFGYLLIAGAAALSLTALDELPILCLITTAAAVVAIAASITSWLPVGSWYALLGVTAVPFGIGVVSVLIERSGWTALSTGVIFLLAATLLLSRRTGAAAILRIGAAALLVPTLAVVVVCLTAELPQSGSPYALPIIAAIVACALPTTGIVRAGLVRRGFPEPTANAVRLAIEISALVTGAIAVILALVRIAAGFEIAFIVLLVLGLGAAATALWLKRRYGWWTAGAAWTGALWCAWAMIGVTVVEPYLLPPAIAAMTVGLVLVARRRSGAGVSAPASLFATGLAIAVIPSLAILAITGNGTGSSFEVEPTLWRAYALILAGVVLTVLAGWITRPAGASPTRFEAIRRPLLLGALVAAAGGVVEGIRLGWERDPLPLPETHAMLQVLAFAVVAAATAIALGTLAQLGGSTSRWIFAPALVFLVLGPMTAIENDPTSIWTLWALELVLLAAMIVTAWRAGEHPTVLPPVWFQWSLAWVVAVVAWSQREILRVEGFALPLGLALVLVGTIGLVRGARDGEVRTLNGWPIGFTRSWALLAPGIVATLLPSMLATFTDPQTWRAILVIGLALVAVLVGARKTLAAPFILGISALPLEILIVFLVQIGTTINPLLWWITLATAGIVLLVIAVGWERRTGADASLAARIRDLK